MIANNSWWVCECGMMLHEHDGGDRVGTFGRRMEEVCECGKLSGHAKLKRVPVGYLSVRDDVYVGIAWNEDRGKDDIFCGGANYWVVRCNICNGLTPGFHNESEPGSEMGLDWHKECQTANVEPPGKEIFKARLVNVKRWHAKRDYLWLEDDREEYEPKV